MAITKTLENDKIEVVQKWNIQVRSATIIKEDGTELSRSFKRHVLVPGSLKAGTGSHKDDLVETDISGEDADVQAICNAVLPLVAGEGQVPIGGCEALSLIHI